MKKFRIMYVRWQTVMATETETWMFLSDNWKPDETKTVKDVLTEQISVIGENMKTRRFARIQEENGFIASYTHMGGKIVVLCRCGNRCC